MHDSTPDSVPVHWNTKHGHTPRTGTSKTYQARRDLINRCYRPATKGFEHYGGRGIQVCDRWRFGEDGKSGFECFLADVGEPPTPRHTIDRIDTDGHYEPSNCRWATMTEQARNKSNNRWLTGFGRTQLLEDWARESGFDKAVLFNRLKRGMTLEEAVTTKRRKLSDDDVRAIRVAIASGETQASIGRRYAVSISYINHIHKGSLRQGVK